MRLNSAADNVHGGAALALIVGTMAGWTIQEWAAFGALVYSVLLIFEKVVRWRRYGIGKTTK